MAISTDSVLVADHDRRARRELVRLLVGAGYVVHEAGRGDEAIVLAREERPSVAILEIPLPGLSGYEVCRAMKSELGSTFPVLFVSGERTEPYDRVAGLMIGADDYLVKPYAPDELLVRVRLLAERANSVVARAELTPRETQILSLLADGLTQRDIAQHLTISPRTVGTHIDHVLRKLGVRSRAQAVALLLRRQHEPPATGNGEPHRGSDTAVVTAVQADPAT